MEKYLQVENVGMSFEKRGVRFEPLRDISLSVARGEFVTLIGQEVIDPRGNAFYSHSFQFGYAIPFFHTGVEVFWVPSDQLSVMVGITRGWEQSSAPLRAPRLPMITALRTSRR